MTDDKIEMIYDKGNLEKFRQEILAGNLCDIFLPVSFIEADGRIGAVYDTQRYTRFTDLREARASTLIGAVTSLIEKGRQAERRYFFIGEYSMDTSLLFVNEKIPDAALIYQKTIPRVKALTFEDLKRIISPENGIKIKGEDFVRKAMFILSDYSKSYDVVLHDLISVGTEAFRAEC